MDRKSREIGSFLGEKAYLREIFLLELFAKIQTGNHTFLRPRIAWLTDRGKRNAL